MSSQPTARDAVWGSILGVDRTDDTDAVLAALGIPADTPTDDVRAGLAALRIAADGPSICVHSNGSGLVPRADAYVAGTSLDRTAFGPTPAAAVLALAAKLEASDA